MIRFVMFLGLLVSSARADLTVMTWNLHHGEGSDGKYDPSRTARVIADAKADVVLLQEMDRNCSRSGKTDQPAELARLTGMHVVFGKTMNIGSGEYGLAILSRTPLSETKVHPLSGPGEPRIALEARTTVAGKTLRLVSTHLEWRAATARPVQAAEIHGLFTDSRFPVILGGDFNDAPDSPVLKKFSAPWQAVPKQGSAFTSPADKPKEEIDYLFTLGCKASSPAAVLPEAVASDHRPVVATIRLTEKNAPAR